jgi:hypothetical protein
MDFNYLLNENDPTNSFKQFKLNIYYTNLIFDINDEEVEKPTYLIDNNKLLKLNNILIKLNGNNQIKHQDYSIELYRDYIQFTKIIEDIIHNSNFHINIDTYNFKSNYIYSLINTSDYEIYNNLINLLKSNNIILINLNISYINIDNISINNITNINKKYKSHTKYIIKQKNKIIELNDIYNNELLTKNKIIKEQEQEQIIKQLLEELEIKNNKSIFNIFN